MDNVSEKFFKPRKGIHDLLIKGRTEKVLEMAGMLHGHYCPGLALGVKAVECGFGELGIRDNTGMEEIMAVAECNSCVIDGIQFAAGCTLGNNSLIYKDLGKTAVTFYCRGTSGAVRLCVKSFESSGESDEEKREGDLLFERAVKKREKLSEKENMRLKEIWIRRSFNVAAESCQKLFTVSYVKAPEISFAPIMDSQICSVCNEKVMESKAGFKQGEPVCISCAQREYLMVTGQGIRTGSQFL